MSMNNQTNSNDFSATDIIGMVTGIIGCITGFGVVLYVKLTGSIRDKKGTKVKVKHEKPDGTVTEMTMSFTNDEKVQISSKSSEQESGEGWLTGLFNWITGHDKVREDTNTSILESPVVPAKSDIPSIMPEITLEKDVYSVKHGKKQSTNIKDVTANMFSEALRNNNREDIIVGDNRSEIIKDMFRFITVIATEDITTEAARNLYPTPRSDSSVVSNGSPRESDISSATQINREMRAKIISKRSKDDKGKEPDKNYGICLVQEDLATAELPQLKVSGMVEEEGL